MLVRFYPLLGASLLLAAALAAPAAANPVASFQEAPVADEVVPEAAGGSTAVVKASVLEKLSVPKPKKLPDKAMWSSAKAVHDGDRLINYVDGDKQYMTLHFVDCNLPVVKSLEHKAPAERGEYAFCYDTDAVDKVKGFSVYGKGDEIRAVKAGHLVVIATIGVNADPSYGIPDLIEFLGSLDLAGLAKL